MRGYYEESDEVRQARLARLFRNQEHYAGTDDQPGLFVFQGGDEGEDDWYVWLNPEGGVARAGQCLGVGKTRQEAVQQAADTLAWALKMLEETPAPATEG